MNQEEERIYKDLLKTKAIAKGKVLLEMYWTNYWKWIVKKVMKKEARK